MIIRQPYREGNLETYYIRFFFDMTCFLTVNVIFMNIIFGIIIDSFAVLRDKEKMRKEEIHNTCFICSLDRSKVKIGGITLHKRLNFAKKLLKIIFVDFHFWQKFFHFSLF